MPHIRITTRCPNETVDLIGLNKDTSDNGRWSAAQQNSSRVLLAGAKLIKSIPKLIRSNECWVIFVFDKFAKYQTYPLHNVS